MLNNAAIKTAPTVVTVTSLTTGGGTGVGCTTGSIDFTGTNDNMQSIYFRSGANAGTYRTTDSASATAHTWDVATRNAVAIGDTLVAVPLRTHGISTVLFDDTTAMFIDCADAPVLAGTDRYLINVIRLDLATPGQEYAEFSFNPAHFNFQIKA